MTWFNKVINKNDVPTDLIYVAIQNKKGMYYREVSPFGEVDKVLAVPTKEIAEDFISNYKSDMHDYKQAMPKENFIFWVFNDCRDGYYADDIRMREDYVPLWSKS